MPNAPQKKHVIPVAALNSSDLDRAIAQVAASLDQVDDDHGGPISFITAVDGQIEMRAGVFGRRFSAGTAQGVAQVLLANGLEDPVMHSSSMDFSNEYGFTRGRNAWMLWQEGVQMYRDLQRELETDEPAARKRAAKP